MASRLKSSSIRLSQPHSQKSKESPNSLEPVLTSHPSCGHCKFRLSGGPCGTCFTLICNRNLFRAEFHTVSTFAKDLQRLAYMMETAWPRTTRVDLGFTGEHVGEDVFEEWVQRAIMPPFASVVERGTVRLRFVWNQALAGAEDILLMW